MKHQYWNAPQRLPSPPFLSKATSLQQHPVMLSFMTLIQHVLSLPLMQALCKASCKLMSTSSPPLRKHRKILPRSLASAKQLHLNQQKSCVQRITATAHRHRRVGFIRWSSPSSGLPGDMCHHRGGGTAGVHVCRIYM